MNSLSRSGASERAALHGGGGFMLVSPPREREESFFVVAIALVFGVVGVGLHFQHSFTFQHFQFSIGVARGGTCNGNDIISLLHVDLVREEFLICMSFFKVRFK